MKHALAIMLLLTGMVAATPKQTEVAEKFQSVLEGAGNALLKELKDQHADQPGAAEQFQEIEKEFKAEISKALEVFAREFSVTDPEADKLLSEGPSGAEAAKAIRVNLQKLQEGERPTPPLPGFMIKRFENEADLDPWFLETLKRLTSGLVRQSGELLEETE